MQRQADLILGYAKDKREKRQKMAEMSFSIKSALQAMASDEGNTILFNALDYALSKLMSGSANQSLTRCKIIQEYAEDNAAALVSYGITAAMITGNADLIEAFELVIANPKDQLAKRKAATADIKKKIRAVDLVIKDKLDRMMENFRLSAPEFYAQYFNDRKIYDAKTNYTEIRVLLLNKETGMKLEGVLMKAISETNEYTVFSSSNGIADAKQISPETYNLEFELTGFEKVVKNSIEVSPGEKEELVIEMVPVG